MIGVDRANLDRITKITGHHDFQVQNLATGASNANITKSQSHKKQTK